MKTIIATIVTTIVTMIITTKDLQRGRWENEAGAAGPELAAAVTNAGGADVTGVGGI